MADINIVFALLYIVQIFIFASSTEHFIVKSEGERFVFSFSYDYSKDYMYKVAFNDFTPFYGYHQLIESDLTNSQRARFSVEENIYDHVVQLRVEIRNVSRDDAGSYKCSVFQNKTLIKDLSKQIYLTVVYPPGKVHCVQVLPSLLVHPLLESDYTIIECFAIRGSVQGYISCYQQDILALPFSDLYLNVTLMTQKIWMKTAYPINCCSIKNPMSIRPYDCRDTTVNLNTPRTPVVASSPSSNAPATTTASALVKPEHFSLSGFQWFVMVSNICFIILFGVLIREVIGLKNYYRRNSYSPIADIEMDLKRKDNSEHQESLLKQQPNVDIDEEVCYGPRLFSKERPDKSYIRIE